MVREVHMLGDRTAEVTLPEGCLTCGGEVRLRMSPDGARVYCATCRTIARPRVTFSPTGLKLDYPGGAEA